MKNWIITLFLIVSAAASCAHSGSIVAGPMIGHTEPESSQIWLQTRQPLSSLKLTYHRAGEKSKTVLATKDENLNVHVYRFHLNSLEQGTTYEYQIWFEKELQASGSFTTRQKWQYPDAAPDFSFLAGSCNNSKRLEPNLIGKLESDTSIFLSMAKEKADFMLWLGDNWYTWDLDFVSAAGLHDRPAHDRAMSYMQPLLKAMPHYAIWDDHDYGPNNMDKSFRLKDDSRRAFMSFWANPSYGSNNQGIYTQFTWNDVAFFLLDDRWYRDSDDLSDSIGGQPNPDKRMFGKEQMAWLEDALLKSAATPGINYRIIATGSQVLNTVSRFDCFCHYPVEYTELLDFLEAQKINGVVFLTGDRHHSSVVLKARSTAPPLYDITVSPLASSTYKFDGSEASSPIRVLGIDMKQNYSRISFSGVGRNRRMLVEFLGIRGEKLGAWSTTVGELRFSK